MNDFPYETNNYRFKYIDSYSQQKKRFIDSYSMLVLICEYVAEPIHACPEERELWKKKLIDVHIVKKKKNK